MPDFAVDPGETWSTPVEPVAGRHQGPRSRIGQAGILGTTGLPETAPEIGRARRDGRLGDQRDDSQGLAAEVYQHGVSVTCVSPSQIVPTPGTVYHRLVKSIDDPRGEPPDLMAKAALLLATEPLEKVRARDVQPADSQRVWLDL